MHTLPDKWYRDFSQEGSDHENTFSNLQTEQEVCQRNMGSDFGHSTGFPYGIDQKTRPVSRVGTPPVLEWGLVCHTFGLDTAGCQEALRRNPSLARSAILRSQY